MKKFTEKHRFSGTIFENIDLLDDYIVPILDLGFKFSHQSFHVFNDFGGDLFPVSAKNYFPSYLYFDKLTAIDTKSLSEIEEGYLVGTELVFKLSLDFHAANAQRNGDAFFKLNPKLFELFKELEEMSNILNKRGYNVSFCMKNVPDDGSPFLKLMIIYNK
jgi:hypothetical protein